MRKTLVVLTSLLVLASAGGVGRAAVAMPPTVVTPPTISGAATVGSTLSATTGEWRNSPDSFAYRWLRCNVRGDMCNPIAGATASTYRLVAADSGWTIRVDVTATNADGSIFSESAKTAVVSGGGRPKASGVPVVAGPYTLGSWLSVTSVKWSGNPTSSSIHWQRCTSQTSCNDVPGATDDRYRITAADLWWRLHVRETATNTDGVGTVLSALGPVIVGPPRLVTDPLVSGPMFWVAWTSHVLKVSEGTWVGDPTSFSFRWQRCDPVRTACFAIPGATSSSYVLVELDTGHRLRVEVSARNARGTTTALSGITPVIR